MFGVSFFCSRLVESACVVTALCFLSSSDLPSRTEKHSIMMEVKFSAFWPVLVCVVLACMTCVLCENPRMYHNQFAIYVPSGKEAADRIAAKHGFTNIGQVSIVHPILLY